MTFFNRVTILKTMFATAFLLGASATVPVFSPHAKATGCTAYITHWGKTSYSKWRARRNARAGMRWKIRTRMGDTVSLARGIRIDRCKLRDYGEWQCQASVIRNYCF